MPRRLLPPLSLSRRISYTLLLYLLKLIWTLTQHLLLPFHPQSKPPTFKKQYLAHLGPVHFFLPPSTTPHKKLPLYVSLHGGGFCSGAPDKDSGINHRFANALGCIVAAVPYALAPAHRWPDAWIDVETQIEQLLNEEMVDADKVVVGGFSAGGTLALTLRAGVRKKVRGVVSWYPAVDFSTLSTELPTVPASTWAEKVQHKFFHWLVDAVPYALFGARSDVELCDPRVSAAFASVEDLPERMLLAGGSQDVFWSRCEAFVQRVQTERGGGGGAKEGFGGWTRMGGREGRTVGITVHGVGHSFTHRGGGGMVKDEVVDEVIRWVGGVFEGRI